MWGYALTHSSGGELLTQKVRPTLALIIQNIQYTRKASPVFFTRQHVYISREAFPGVGRKKYTIFDVRGTTHFTDTQIYNVQGRRTLHMLYLRRNVRTARVCVGRPPFILYICKLRQNIQYTRKVSPVFSRVSV